MSGNTAPTDGQQRLARFHDPQFSVTSVWIEPGEHYVTDDTGEMIATVVGSCIAACIRDPVAGIGGMNHFMLPGFSAEGIAVPASADMRYGTVAMAQLIGDIVARGGQLGRLEIKVFGGSTMIGRGGLVGPNNADFVERYIVAANLVFAAGDLRGDDARRILYFPSNGRVLMQRLPRLALSTGSGEAGERDSLQTATAAGRGG